MDLGVDVNSGRCETVNVKREKEGRRSKVGKKDWTRRQSERKRKERRSLKGSRQAYKLITRNLRLTRN